MRFRASLLLLPVVSLPAGCRYFTPTKAAPRPILGADALAPSPRLVLGRIIAVDRAQGFAHVELASDAPPAAVADGTDFITRTLELRETGRLRASRFVRGRILGTIILGGQPSPGDEVVWHAP